MYRKRNTLSSVGMKQHNPGRCDVFLKCIYIIIYLRMFGVFRLNSLLVCRSEFYSVISIMAKGPSASSGEYVRVSTSDLVLDTSVRF